MIEARRDYRVTIRLRRDRPLKPGVEVLDGWRVTLRALWLMDDGDPYPGEWAMGFIDPHSPASAEVCGIGWLASGDLADTEPCP